MKFPSFSIFLYCCLIAFRSNADAAISGCEFSGAVQIESSLWVETPQATLTFDQWTAYYKQLRVYVTSNCVNTAITKVIIRTKNPAYGGNILWPPKTSPLMTEFFSTLPGGIDVSFFPYLYGDADRSEWINGGGSSDVIENVFMFSNAWNNYLKSVESAARVTSITIDLGELIPGSIFQVPLTPANIAAYKVKYNIPSIGGLVSYDDKNAVLLHADVLDQFYLLISGFYYPSVNVDKSATESPFVLHKNDAAAMSSFVINNVFLPGIKNTYLPYLAKMNALWSTQSPTGKCLYPNADGTCQSNYEFGTWTAEGVNAFIRQVKADSPDFFAKMQHGFFQFNYIPTAWATSTSAIVVTPSAPVVTPSAPVVTPAEPVVEPATVIAAASGVSVAGCASHGAVTTPGFLWAETPWQLNTMADFVTYFRGMRKYISNNCVNVQFNKLVIRVPTPLSYPGVFSNPKTSPMYTELISTLPAYVEIHILPYLMTDANRLNWVNYGGSRDVIENVFIYAVNWNSFLKSAGNGVRVRGIVLDYEELKPSAKYAMTLSVGIVKSYKNAYGISQFGGAIGYDDTPKLLSLTYYDNFYLEFYDFYQPYVNVDKSAANSKFMTLRNDPADMVSYITDTILQKAIVNGYGQTGATLNAMWSLQSALGNCIYPLSDGSCYSNYEFGVWRPDTFNAFLRQLTAASGVMRPMNHGMFQYSFTPRSWIPDN